MVYKVILLRLTHTYKRHGSFPFAIFNIFPRFPQLQIIKKISPKILSFNLCNSIPFYMVKSLLSQLVHDPRGHLKCDTVGGAAEGRYYFFIL